ncbi:MAG: hypothetical protein A2096_09045 [Spirochaetes bacterium GWF1_41_5]|nr:MAG: hypothetical protein A2096_09045 [Spirochaetes bacterium GWF1_41_5]
MTLPGTAGRFFFRQLGLITGQLALLYFSLSRLFKGKLGGRSYIFREIVMQVYFTGVKALSLISIIGLVMGISIIFILNRELSQVGFGTMLGYILNLLVIRNLGPLLTGIIIIARSGTAITAHIGNMTVAHELEAMETMGIDTLTFLIAPRIIGMVLSLLALNIFFDMIAVAGGAAVAKILEPTFVLGNFFFDFLTSLSFWHILEFIFKSIFFATGISIICLLNGFKVGNSITNVPVAATKAVVSSMLYLFFINTLITIIFNLKIS